MAWTVALVCAASRFLATARSLWDWDEALFCLGMRSYDVASHHPHPPGFPLYIALGHLARFLLRDDFRALQSINLVAGALLFPAMLLLARELRLRFDVAFTASTLLAFFPNVWFFGGTAFSDVPSLTLVVFASAMLLRGCRDRSAYLAGTFALALAIGIRPQNLLVGLWPGLVATRCRARQSLRDVFAAAAIGVAVTGAAFAGAIAATGSWQAYFDAIRAHSRYISEVDSFRAPGRPPLWRIFDRFFLKQYESPPLSALTSIFVAISAAGAIRARDRRIGTIAMTFAPFAIVAWLMLDRFSINRFSIGYAPLFAVLAADGIARVARRSDLTLAIGAVLTLAFLLFTWPALTVVRTTVSPTVAGAMAARKLDLSRDRLYVGDAMRPFVEVFLPGTEWTRVLDERALPLSAPRGNAWLLTELDHTRPPAGSGVFRRAHGRLWNIARRHYFDVALEPIATLPQFESGWYGPERDGHDESRWMSASSHTILPPAAGRSHLTLDFEMATEVMPMHPTVTIRLNGNVVDRIQPADVRLVRQYDVDALAGPNVLDIEIDHTVNPLRQHLGTDPRDLGILLHQLSWGAP